MNKPKLYVFDIDGTLLTTEYKILPSTKQAMSLLAESELQRPCYAGQRPLAPGD